MKATSNLQSRLLSNRVRMAPMRTSRDETRRQIVSSGVRLLMERGLEGGCGNVGMSDVLADIEHRTGRRITNASVYGRIWATQSDFHRDLLFHAAEEFPKGEEVAFRERANEVLRTTDLATEEGRRRALKQICLVGGKAHLDALADSRSWQTWLAIWAITVSTPSLDDDLERGPAIAHRHAVAVAGMTAVLGEILPRVGLSLRPGHSFEHLSMAVYALSEGLVLHDRFAAPGASAMQMRDTPWPLFSVALLAIIDAFSEASTATSGAATSGAEPVAAKS